MNNIVKDMEAVREFQVKDSGKREQYDSGMVRDTTEGKTLWSLVYDGPMLKRWAKHLTAGAKKYSPRNWMKATGQEELDRAIDSAARHFAQWMAGERDEDHGAAVFFNINLAEYIRERMEKKSSPQTVDEALRQPVRWDQPQP